MRKPTQILAATWFLIVAPALTFAEEHPPLAIAPFNAEQAKEFQQQWADHIGKERVYANSIGMSHSTNAYASSPKPKISRPSSNAPMISMMA